MSAVGTSSADPYFQAILDRATQSPRVIALAEGWDARVASGAIRAQQSGVADVILVGPRAEVFAQVKAQGGDPDTMRIMDPADREPRTDFAHKFYELRAHKGMTQDRAAQVMRDPLYFASMLVRAGVADGCVGGAVATTADTVRAALHVIGKAKEAKQVSSFFLMQMDMDHHPRKGLVIFADCGMVVDPDAEGLADIALTSAKSLTSLTGQAPRIGMLSFSTKGSAHHANVTKVVEATALAQAAAPDMAIDGELQFDAAIMPDVAASKAPGSPVAGQTNVFVFPNLDAGNIGYKIAQRIGGAKAMGPVLQGLAKPANDLSRGCNADDVYRMIAITAAQA